MIIIAVAVGLSTCVALMNRAGEELVPWRTDADAAIQDARTASQPTLLYFTADWCGPCRYMKENTWSDPAVAKALESYQTVKIDIDKQPDTAARYQIRGIPRMIVLNPDGSVQRDEAGGMDPAYFVSWLKR
jgi:thiol:disulfide interchange protein